jgi:hypothetical protein
MRCSLLLEFCEFPGTSKLGRKECLRSAGENINNNNIKKRKHTVLGFHRKEKKL